MKIEDKSKMFLTKVIVFVVALAYSGESSTLKGLNDIETVGIESTDVPVQLFTETATEEFPTEAPEDLPKSQMLKQLEEIPISNESRSTDELTEPADIENGSFFKLMMTVKQDWTDEFMDRKSEPFNKLAEGLGGELIDLIDNSQESKEINMTSFHLVEVQPSKESEGKVYATFVVSAKKEISGEDLSIAIKNRVALYGAVYNYEATNEGFVVANITEEEAKEMESEKIACSSGKRNFLIWVKDFILKP